MIAQFDLDLKSDQISVERWVEQGTKADLDEYIRVQDHQALGKLVGNLDALLDEVAVHLEEEVVRVAIVARLLFLPGYEHSRLGRLGVFLEAEIELEQVLGVLGYAVMVAQQVLDQLIGQGLVRRLAYALNRQIDRFRLDLGVRLFFDQMFQRLQ